MRLGLFPGQGIPARIVLASLEAADSVVQKASEVLDYDLRDRVAQVARRQRGLLPTSLAQPAIFTASVAGWRRQSDERFERFLGHSVGEYAALVAGGAMGFEDALEVVRVRGHAMEKASRACDGGMVVILDLKWQRAEEIADVAGVTLANDNSNRQVVLAGDHGCLANAASMARAEGGRAVRLEVSGPFHTVAMAPARRVLREALEQIDIRSPHTAVLSNVSADAYRSPGEIRKLLVEQVTSRVRFREALERSWDEGCTDCHDFGPGQVMANLATRTRDELRRDQPANVG